MRVTGDFNDWSAPGSDMMRSLSGDGWTMDLTLNPGVYRYVFVQKGEAVPTGEEFRKQVQVIVLPPADFKLLPAVKGDGLITESGIQHHGDSHDLKRINLRTYEVTLRTRKDDVLSEAIAVWSEGGKEQKNYPLKFVDSDPLFDYYQVKVVVDPTATFYYRFLLDDGTGTRAYDKAGLSKGIIGGDPFAVRPNQLKIPPDIGVSDPTLQGARGQSPIANGD